MFLHTSPKFIEHLYHHYFEVVIRELTFLTFIRVWEFLALGFYLSLSFGTYLCLHFLRLSVFIPVWISQNSYFLSIMSSLVEKYPEWTVYTVSFSRLAGNDKARVREIPKCVTHG